MSKRKFLEAFAQDKNVPFERSSVESSKVQEIDSSSQFLKLIEENEERLIVVIFFVEKSAPCSQMRRMFHPLSVKFINSLFLEVDTDKNEDIRKSHEIEDLPTFVFYKNNKPIHKVQGAFPEKFEESLCTFSSDTEASAQLRKEKESAGKGSGDVSNFIDMKKSECLNSLDEFPFKDFVMRKAGSKLISDCDEQLILCYGFNQNLRLHGIKIKAPAGKGPSSLKLFPNQLKSLDFDDVSTFQHTQEMILTAEDLKGEKIIELNRVKFSKVTSLHIFIPRNQSGEETTEIESLTILGEPVNKTLGVSGHTSKVVFLD